MPSIDPRYIGFRPCVALTIKSGHAPGEPMISFAAVVCPVSADACPGRDNCQYTDNGNYLVDKVRGDAPFEFKN